MARRAARTKPRKRSRRRLRLPGWLPLAGIIAVIIGIMSLVFFARQTTAAQPSVGDHIHAALNIYVCGQKEPPLPFFEAGVHTHGDGLIHIHPESSSEEGAGAAVGKFFQYGGWQLTSTTLGLPGDVTFNNGDACPDGRTGVLRMLEFRLSWRSNTGNQSVLSDECSRVPDSDMQEVKDFPGYVPKDGDCLHLVFGPAGANSVYGTPTPTGSPIPTPVPEG